MIRKLLQIYLLWRMVRKSRLMAQESWKRRYFRGFDFVSQLDFCENIYTKEKEVGYWLPVAMDFNFFPSEMEKTDYADVYRCPMERDVPKFDTSLHYFTRMREINQFYRKRFWSLLKKII